MESSICNIYVSTVNIRSKKELKSSRLHLSVIYNLNPHKKSHNQNVHLKS